jgi:hypothetical protein
MSNINEGRLKEGWFAECNESCTYTGFMFNHRLDEHVTLEHLDTNREENSLISDNLTPEDAIKLGDILKREGEKALQARKLRLANAADEANKRARG